MKNKEQIEKLRDIFLEAQYNDPDVPASPLDDFIELLDWMLDDEAKLGDMLEGVYYFGPTKYTATLREKLHD